MRHKTTTIRDLRNVLRDIIPFVKNPKSLYTGRDLPSFSQRPREILANWLICAAASDPGESDWTFGEDPMGGDGLLINRSTKEGWPTEHVFIPSPESPHNESVANLMVNAVEHKNKKGEPYATGKCLVIFAEGIDRQWFPNDVYKRIKGQHHFDSVWAVGLQESAGNDYKYFVVCLDEYPCPCCIISVNLAKAEWIVERIQLTITAIRIFAPGLEDCGAV